MLLSSSVALLALLISAESLTFGPTTLPAASSLPVPSTPAPSLPVARPSPRPSFPVARPSSRPTLGSTKPPVVAALSPVFAPVAISQPSIFGNTPTLPVGAWTSAPVAISLDVCVQEDARLNACANTATDTCKDSCANILASVNEGTSECEALGAICAVVQCCNVCVEETNAYGVCVMNQLQCSANQCNSSAESNAIAVTMIFLASMSGFGLLWW